MITIKEDITAIDINGKKLHIGDSVEFKQKLNSNEAVVEGIVVNITPTAMVGGIGHKIDVRTTSYRSMNSVKIWSHQVAKREVKRVAV